MEEPIIESYLNSIYYWRVIKKTADEVGVQRIIKIVEKMNKILVDYLTSIRFDLDDKMKKEIINYRVELQSILPNIRINSEEFDQHMFTYFLDINSSLCDNKFNLACSVLDSLKNQFIYTETIPKFLVSDITFKNTESLFKEKVMKSTNLSEEMIIDEIKNNFTDFFKVNKLDFSVFLTSNVKKYFAEMNEIQGNFIKEISKKLFLYLENLFDRDSILFIEVQMMKFNELNTPEDQVWETIHQGPILNEEIQLSQILKFNQQKILICLKFQEIQITVLLILDNFIVKKVKNTTSFIFDKFVPGSVPEFMLLYSNKLKKMWKARLTDEQLSILDNELNIYPQHNQLILSCCFIKHQQRILYIYESGGIGDFVLSSSGYLDLSEVYPQRYSSIFVSDCERFIFIVGDSSFNIYSNKMKMITFHKIVPVCFVLVEENLKIVFKGISDYEFKKVRFNAVSLTEKPNIEMTGEKVKYFTRMTIEFGKTLVNEMTNINRFSGVSSEDEVKRDN